MTHLSHFLNPVPEVTPPIYPSLWAKTVPAMIAAFDDAITNFFTSNEEQSVINKSGRQFLWNAWKEWTCFFDEGKNIIRLLYQGGENTKRVQYTLDEITSVQTKSHIIAGWLENFFKEQNISFLRKNLPEKYTS